MDGTSVVRRPPFGSNPLVGERGSDTQRRILEAALEVFAEVGFNEARVELITKKAGCSRPAFYQYFSSKDDVFWKLAGQLGQEMVELGDQLGSITRDAAGVETLGAWIDDLATLYRAYAPVFAAFHAASRGHRSLSEGSSSINDRMGAALLHGFGIDTPDKVETRLAAGIVTVLIRCVFYWDSIADPQQHDALVRGMAELIHRQFTGPVDGVNIHRRKGSGRSAAAPVPGPAAAVVPVDGHRALRPRGQRTRQLLLDAGTKVLPARGYHDARVDDIVEVAGVSHGSFYRYFENKEDYFRVLAEETSTSMVDLLGTFPVGGTDEDLRQWLEAWFAAYQSNGGVISTWQEMQTAEADLVGFSQQVAATVIDQLIRLLERRDFGDPFADALVLLALVERIPWTVFTVRFTKKADAVETMVAVVRHGLFGLPH